MSETIQHNDPTPSPTWSFPVDVFESDDALRLVADLPGVPADAVEVELHGADLAIRATQRRSVGEPRTYERTFKVRVPVEGDGVDAAMSAGVLTLTLRKSDAVRPRKVPVKAA